MNSLKKHFDKVLLAGLLLVFCLVLVMQLFSVMASTVPIGEQEMNELQSLKPDYKKMGSEIFEGRKAILDGIRWEQKGLSDTAIKWASDLFEVPTSSEGDKAQLLRCRHCKKLVPYSDFANNECSECGKEIQVAVVVEIIDTDKDGIPDDLEILMGTNPNVDDLDDDIDGDGFSNWEEYQIALISADEKGLDKPDFSAITDPKKHPALNQYLAFVEERRIELPIKLQTITPRDPEDKSTWAIILVIGRSTQRFNLSDTFRLRNEIWTIKNARLRERGLQNSKNDRIQIENEKNEVIVIEATQKTPVFHPQSSYILKNHMVKDENDGKFAVEIGQEFKIGTDKIGVENYKLNAFDSDKKSVIIENTLDSSKVVIDSTAKRTGIVSAKKETVSDEKNPETPLGTSQETSLDQLLQ